MKPLYRIAHVQDGVGGRWAFRVQQRHKQRWYDPLGAEFRTASAARTALTDYKKELRRCADGKCSPEVAVVRGVQGYCPAFN